MKHLEVKYLFLQDVTAKKRAFVHKVATADNPADLGTKWHGTQRLDYLRGLVGMKLPVNNNLELNVIWDYKYQYGKQHHMDRKYYQSEESGERTGKLGRSKRSASCASKEKRRRQRCNHLRQPKQAPSTA